METGGKRLTAATMVALCSLALTGCNSDDKPDDAGSAPTTAHIFEPEVVDSGDGDVGTAPVLDLRAGDHTTTTFDITMTYTVDHGTTGTIPITVTTDTTVLEVSDAFDRVRTRIRAIDVDTTGLDPDKVGELTTPLDRAEGFIIDRQLSPYGGVLSSDFPHEDVAAREALGFFANVPGFPMFGMNVTALPSDAVSVGAVWRKDVAYLQAGTPKEATMKYTLEDLDEDGYRTSFQVRDPRTTARTTPSRRRDR